MVCNDLCVRFVSFGRIYVAVFNFYAPTILNPFFFWCYIDIKKEILELMFFWFLENVISNFLIYAFLEIQSSWRDSNPRNTFPSGPNSVWKNSHGSLLRISFYEVIGATFRCSIPSCCHWPLWTSIEKKLVDFN